MGTNNGEGVRCVRCEECELSVEQGGTDRGTYLWGPY